MPCPHRFNCRPGQTTDRSRSTSLTSCPAFLLISPHRTETLFSLFRALHTCGRGSRAKSSSYTRQSNPAPHSGPKGARVYLNEPRLSKPIFPRSASYSSYDVRASHPPGGTLCRTSVLSSERDRPGAVPEGGEVDERSYCRYPLTRPYRPSLYYLRTASIRYNHGH
jgi:hypothetical protein